MVMNPLQQAEWIWYPNDYEVWLRGEVEGRREERGIPYPPMWKVERPYVNVAFRKKVQLDQEETLNIYAQGSLLMKVNDAVVYAPPPLRLPAGSYQLEFIVTERDTFPALFVSGTAAATDSSWKASCFTGKWVSPGSAGYSDPHRLPSVFSFDLEEQRPVRTWREADGRLLADFGKQTFGYLQLHGVQKGTQLFVYYGESLEEALDREYCELLDRIQIDCDVSWTHTKGRAFRYAAVEAAVPAGEQAFSLVHPVTCLYESLPVEYKGLFRCSDERINRIWSTSVYTLHLNTRELFLDGIKRDGWVWSGDAYESFLMNYYSFFELGVTKRTLAALRGKDPVESHLNTILDYSFYWFISMYDYYLYTGDMEFIRGQYRRMEGLMDFCLSRLNADGLVEGHPGDWVYIDWAEMDNTGEVCAEQLLMARSLEIMAYFSGKMGDRAETERYDSLANGLKSKTMALFWDEAQGGLVHHRAHGEVKPHLTKYANMFALMFGFLDEGRAETVKRRVMLNGEVQPIKTPYMRFHELSVLCDAGEHTKVLAEMRAYWGGMLDLGATSFWEEYDPSLQDSEQLSMYGRPYGKSLCHAWGASPIYLLGKHYLGVRPLEPGYSLYVIEPNLGDLDWIEGEVPTPMGTIRVYADREKLRVTSPGGTGYLRIRSSSLPAGYDGNCARMEDERYEIAITEPNRTYEIRYNM
ncbi:alpha-L-rhamnosidase-related protein [Paenibacillus gansuensis]|uniref:Alpha-L-rhamnosidase C-terminal domain-containing protein n=1 Tax=Paenibacillus gansuensis TaxID=306542 RepID=A0ABW5PJB4_9BACL